MREIKFRAKRIDKDEFAYGDHLTGMGYKKGKHYILPLLSHYPYDCHSLDGYEVIPETIGQYTGLKDKNGKEIYEGDIVEWTFFYERLGANMGVIEDDTIVKGIIRCRQGGFVLEVIENDFEDAGYYSISALYTDTESDVEIIGNIYDNPELIKEEEK